jgi:phage-related tail protein
MSTNNGLSQRDLESIEHVIYKQSDDIAVALGRSFERLEERMDAMESRLCSRLSELEDKTEACRQNIAEELGDIRSDLRQFAKAEATLDAEAL